MRDLWIHDINNEHCLLEGIALIIVGWDFLGTVEEMVKF